MLKRLLAAAALLLALATPALAQQVAAHAIPLGRGAGVSGFNAIAPAANTKVVAGGGTSSDFAAVTVSGDCSMVAGAFTCTKTNGSSFATVATSGSASDLGTGTLPNARLDAEVQCIAGLTSAADKVTYYTGSGTCALADFSSALRTLITTASSANLRAMLTDESGTGLAYFQGGDLGTPSALVGTNITGTASGLTAGNVTTNANLTGPITSVGNATTVADAELAALAGLTSAADKVSYFTGLGTAALTDLVANGRTLIGHTFSQMRTDLGLVIGTNVEAWDADLDTIAGLTATTNNFMVGVSSAWASRTPAQVRTTLALTVGTDVEAWDTDLDSWAAITRASGFDTFVATPSSANLRSLLSDEVGTGAAYFVGGALGTPASGTGTNLTGTAASLTAGNVTTNANLTGPITSSGNATSIASQTGTGTKFVVDNTPTLITPNIGAATGSSAVLTGSSVGYTPFQGISTEAAAAAGPIIDLYRNSASPAANDNIGSLTLTGQNSTPAVKTYASIGARIDDATAGSEDASLFVATMKAGTLTNYVDVGANAAGTATANAVGLPLGQLSFPATQNASADANTLDDYEEGSWTPGISFGNGTTGITYSLQAGSYIKIGALVFVSASITLTNKGSSTGSARITGLPFTANATFGGAVPYYQNMATFTAATALIGASSGTTADFFIPGASGITAATNSNFTNTSDLRFSAAYSVN